MRKTLSFFSRHYAIFIFIFSFLILLILFLWDEDLSFDRKINDTKVNNFFVCLATLLTIVSVLILYKEYYEKILERQPLIMIESLSFFTLDVEPNNYSNIRIREFYSDPNKTEKIWSPSLSLINIGFGAAISIELKWEYNEYEVQNFVHPYYNPFGQPVKHDSISFIAKEGYEKIKIPGYYLTTLGYSLHEDSLDYAGDNPPKRPNLALVIIYKDIFNKAHRKKFGFDISAFAGIVHMKPILIKENL